MKWKVFALVALALSMSFAPALAAPVQASSSPFSITDSDITFVTQPIPGQQCPQPWWGDPAVCGESGQHITSIAHQPVLAEVLVCISTPVSGVLSVEVRKDIILYPDGDLTTVTFTLSSASGCGYYEFFFTPTEGGMWFAGVWPFDAGSIRDYYLKVSFNGSPIYDPTNAPAQWGVGPVIAYVSLGRPSVQVECGPGGNTAPNGLGRC